MDEHLNRRYPINPHQIRRLFPRASASLLAANAGDYGKPAEPKGGWPASRQPTYDHQANHPWQAPELERDPGNAPLAAGQVQETADGRIHVRVCSVRKRLLDEDNLREKFMVDSLRAIAAIPADDPATVRIETTQRKAAKGEAEHTEITITYP